MIRSRPFALACAGLVSVAMAGTATATVGASAAESGATAARVGGLNGPRGFDIGASGLTVVAEADGTISKAFRFGDRRGTTKKIASVGPEFLAPSVAVGPDDSVWVLTVGGESSSSGTLFRKAPGRPLEKVRNISAWVAKHHPDPYDLEKAPTESNPYGVAVGRDGNAYVADAANNAVLRVSKAGKVAVVAEVKPRKVELPEPATRAASVPSEAVTTAVTVGPDGSVYIGELRGGPAFPGDSQVWRVRPGATGAVCRPARPDTGACKRYADGLTSIVDLDTGRGGSLYVAELSKMGWMSMESETPPPGSEIGAVIRISHDRTIRRELGEGKVIMPGSVAVGRAGNVFVSGPIFGPGSIFRVR
ncbi:ScyD/ScyE family protein [Nocardioides mesophilus]|uniref:ScyD/ScyE family protein n=1 Tax=Nocardioides mesophilus TaxID=433659 RepID=A0A7G9RC67_9ACTN|nr:ScyD/ScyE family protein [Nocardioides mesophilus]QNN53192.1 ScyD/ScyE family protein [Nocardioides mesophilus]